MKKVRPGEPFGRRRSPEALAALSGREVDVLGETLERCGDGRFPVDHPHTVIPREDIENVGGCFVGDLPPHEEDDFPSEE